MKIEFVEIGNFRKLKAVRIDLATAQTIFVGANNSGKTSAMVALRYFLVGRQSFSIKDFTLCNWHTINEWGEAWDCAYAAGDPLPATNWREVSPWFDIWLNVSDTEIHHVQGILPSLDWTDGRLGVRLALEPAKGPELQQEYVKLRAANKAVQTAAIAAAAPDPITENAASKIMEGGTPFLPETIVGSVAPAAGLEASPTSSGKGVQLWPECLTDFLSKRLGELFTVR
jgi:AAA ATPase domain